MRGADVTHGAHCIRYKMTIIIPFLPLLKVTMFVVKELRYRLVEDSTLN